MVQFCPSNQSLLKPWVNDGLTRCFIDTLHDSILILALIAFLLQIFYIKRYGHRITQSRSPWFYLLIVMGVLIPVMAVVQSVLFAFFNVPEKNTAVYFHGFLILNLVVRPAVWLVSLAVLYMDCVYFLACPRTKHSYSLLFLWMSSLLLLLLPIVSVRSTDWWWRFKSPDDIAHFCLWIVQVFGVIGVLVLGLLGPSLPKDHTAIYNNLQSDDISHAVDPLTRYYRRFQILAPCLWPRDNKVVQFKVIVSIALLVAGRVVNLYSPIFYKQIVDSLTFPTNATNVTGLLESPNRNYVNLHQGLFHQLFDRLLGPTGLAYRWDYVLQLGVIRLLQGFGVGGGGGLIGAIRAQLWIAVDQFSTRELSVNLFAHLQSLSLRWHLSRKTGEMLRIMDRGTSSVSNILSYLAFNIVPTIIDIIIGVIYFLSAFNVWYGLIVIATMGVYLGSTMAVTEWRAKYRRDMNEKDNHKSTKAVDALLNFETVKYFNAESSELSRFRTAFLDYQKAEWWTNFSLNVLNTVQNVTVTIGLLVGTLLCAHDVVLGTLTVGDFVLFNTYMLQLYSPLSIFGMYYRMLQTSLIDMENMFDLLDEQPEVLDAPNAKDLCVMGGEVEFRNVSFHYAAERPILKNISFKVPAGHTVALVGQSGAGKSTIVRLLFRLYDVIQGEILIDGQNVADLTQASVRRAIGVVPQDTVLFNDTIRYNIRYGRQTATNEEVLQAARAADIHERILEFPDQYETIVGERGLKLSGGEKQRVAIARNVLKNPYIMLLDEATSALDTTTERIIQSSLYKMAQNRTTLVVAHRLSTIVNADEIIMMHQGEIVERGTHQQLLAIPDGRYAKLWQAQSETGQNSIDRTDSRPGL
ncbi:ATP-binding cassette sub- B member 6, mitochondrial [Clonorchis sinensis]|uniref:ATP-binding cassette sub-family B member 6 n=1 Tax=Clonorchis sinensis TaxID=79923 RepID=A0A8T1MCR8_CLOSI|nr:ATP-binding cassette sub- B member 6, mitochondrial [Clonorchis sinensis]